MAYTTESNYTGNGSATDYTITFPFLDSGDIKATVNSVTTSAFTVAGTTLTFTTAPANTHAIKIYRDTNIENVKNVFHAGASIRAQDLNNIAKQFLYAAQEFEQASTTPSGTGLALTASTKNHIVVNSQNDWTLASGAAVANLANDSIDSQHYAPVSIDREHLAADIIDGTKIDDNAIDSEHYVDGSIDHVHLAGDCIDGDNIQNDAINSEHYVDASIDHQHLSNDCIDSDNLSDNSVGNEHMKDDAVGVAELSATGTASSSTFLRGDNSWAAGGLFSAYAILKQVESANTDGGSSGTDWTDRVINTEIDPSSIVSISSNKFTLGAGNYLIKFRATFWDTEDARLRIYDVTNSAERIISGIGYGATAYYRNPWTEGIGRLTPSGSTEYKLQGKADIARSNTGHGYPSNMGTTEEYVQIEIYKES